MVRAGDVRAILERYPLAPAPVRCVARMDNVLYRVGRDHVLRIHDPGTYTTAQIRSELLWLDALANETDVRASVPVRNRDDDLVTVHTGGERCTLLRWVHGRMHGDRPRPHHFEQLGATMAKLHAHAAAWQRPADFDRPVWNAESIFGTDGFLSGDGNPWPFVPADALDGADAGPTV